MTSSTVKLTDMTDANGGYVAVDLSFDNVGGDVAPDAPPTPAMWFGVLVNHCLATPHLLEQAARSFEIETGITVPVEIRQYLRDET